MVNSVLLEDTQMCFNKDEFMKTHFSIEDFIVDCRRRVPLDTLRSHLNTHLKVLQNSLVELINKDYADFVNLSSNLVGLDGAIQNLTVPIGQLSSVAKDTQEFMTISLSELDATIARKTIITNQKALLCRLSGIIQTVDRMERLLGIEKDNTDSSSTTVVLTGQLIERSATQLNKLNFNVGKCQGHALITELQPRIDNIIGILENGLRQKFLEAITCRSNIMPRGEGVSDCTCDTTTVSTLRRCLRTYSAIDKVKVAEDLFRSCVVRPYVSKIINDFYQSNSEDLSVLYTSLLDFINTQCERLLNITNVNNTTDASCVVEGFDFLVNAVWPEIVNSIDGQLSYIYAPGNPDNFHTKYLQTHCFIDDFEKLCQSETSVRHLRKRTSYLDFMAKWSMPVYFQIRFQEIAGSYENSLDNPFVISQDSEFHLVCTNQLYVGLQRCWSDDIYIQTIAHRFWKLCLQLLSRHLTAAAEFIEKQSTLSKDSALENFILFINDTVLLRNKADVLYNEVIIKKLNDLDINNISVFTEAYKESCDALLQPIEQIRVEIISCISDRCICHTKSINDIPRLYRHTNKEAPTKASLYIHSMMKPLEDFHRKHKQLLSTQDAMCFSTKVIDNILQSYLKSTRDLLMSVAKMEESIKRLKKAKSTAQLQQAGHVSDDDKIRQQIHEDVKELGEKIKSCDIDPLKISHYNDLCYIINAAIKK